MKEQWDIPEAMKAEAMTQLSAVQRQAFSDAMKEAGDDEHKAKAIWIKTMELVLKMNKQNQDERHFQQRLAAGQADEGGDGRVVINIVEASKPEPKD